MHFSHALIALVAAGLANAQIPNVPSCSLNCFVSALTSDGCSSLTDFACHCQKTQLVSDITPCVQKACAVSDQASVSNVVVSECSAAGHPISLPPVETTSASSGSSTPTETSASATDSSNFTTASSTGSSSSSGESSASATSSGSAATISSVASSSSTGSGSTPAVTSTPLASKTGASSGSSSSPTYTGAAANVKGNMAGVAAIAAAAAYIL